jgi:hypothetical protein
MTESTHVVWPHCNVVNIIPAACMLTSDEVTRIAGACGSNKTAS